MMDVTLDEEQEAVVTRMLAWTVSNKWVIGLEGPPGSGKTTLLKAFARRCGKRIRMTAPTNKATKVLRKLIGTSFPNVEFSTTYSALGLKMDTGGEIKKIFKPSDLESLDEVDILVVDERSMVNQELWQYIEGECRSRGIKVIVVGDRWQLPPVNEELSPTFDIEDNIVLTKIHRQAEKNPIIQLLGQIRECIPEGRWPQFTTAANDGGGVYCMNYEVWCRNMRAGFASETYQNKDDSFKTVAWTNRTVDSHNQQIRRAVYGPEEAAQPFLLGERVIAAAPVRAIENAPFDGEMFTDEEGIIEDITVDDHPLFKTKKFKVWNLTISTDRGYVSGYVIHKDSKGEYEDRLAELSSMAKAKKIRWDEFWSFKDSFHDIRPCHAITTHKSQGSTYENVFVDVADIAKNPNTSEALRMLYVAVSRASKRVMLRTGND